MKGKHHIVVENKRIRYEFDVKRNITIIRGDSATGKTTLIDMIETYENLGDSSGVTVNSDCMLSVLGSADWKLRIENGAGKIFFIDEGNSFVVTQKFAEAVKSADAYFVLILRDNLPNLPYSIEEIYGIRESSHYGGLKKTYNELYHLYGNTSDFILDKNTLIVTEDSNSGYDFFSYKCSHEIISAQGKSNIKKLIIKNTGKNILVIADGAAFGSEMESVMRLSGSNKRIMLYLPESFEWIVLDSDLFNDSETKEILSTPEEYIDSRKFFSWERFFTRLLIDKSGEGYLRYKKDKINNAYLHSKNRSMIIEAMPEQIRNIFDKEVV